MKRMEKSFENEKSICTFAAQKFF